MKKEYRIAKGSFANAIDIRHREDGTIYTVNVWRVPRIDAGKLAADICALLNSGKYDKKKQ